MTTADGQRVAGHYGFFIGDKGYIVNGVVNANGWLEWWLIDDETGIAESGVRAPDTFSGPH